ncbi:MAG TPA: hypothetical protein VIM10_03220 [Actinopolymorphaceae bacterium]|jgi:hypothetical protein
MRKGWWRLRRRRPGGPAGRGAARKVDADAVTHLREFAATRVGVEGFVEPRTAVTDTTLVMVARDGEWTRRRVPNARAAHALCNDLQVPSYDAAVVGYPARMRAWSARKRQGDLGGPDDL